MDDADVDSVIHTERALRYLSKILESGFNPRSILKAQSTTFRCGMTAISKKHFIFLLWFTVWLSGQGWLTAGLTTVKCEVVTRFV